MSAFTETAASLLNGKGDYATAAENHIMAESLRDALTVRLAEQGFSARTAKLENWYFASAKLVRDILLPGWEQTKEEWNQSTDKQAHLVVIEWLPGPHMFSAVKAAGVQEILPVVLNSMVPKEAGYSVKDIYGYEPDPATGNGGLGRLESCFLVSAAFLHLPVMGYGIEWEEGFMRQVIENKRQVELPDKWLINGTNPWGVVRHDREYPVPLFGEYRQSGPGRHEWNNAIPVSVLAHDVMVPFPEGNGARTLRMWGRNPDSKIKTDNPEQYALIDMLTKRLYPRDKDNFGRNLRFAQEYLLASASIQDILDCHLNRQKQSLDDLPKKKAIQLNDTHPVIAIPELMRVLIDQYDVGWDKAKEITRGVNFYANHTLAGEASEVHTRGIYRYITPRLEGIIDGLQGDLTQEVISVVSRRKDPARRTRDEVAKFQDAVAIVVPHGGDGLSDEIRSKHLAMANVQKVNGVSKPHTELFRELHPHHLELRGNDFIKTTENGVTPVSWWEEAQPALSGILTQKVGNDSWLGDLTMVDGVLKGLQSDAGFRADFRKIDLEQKVELAAYIKKLTGLVTNPEAFTKMQGKRFHGYKRQFLDEIGIVALYLDIKNNPNKERPPVVAILAGKAAPDYQQAKDEVALANCLADIINNDPAMKDRLQVVFLEDYKVSMAKIIIPAADLQEHISTAGWEAAGTSQVKPGGCKELTYDGNNIKLAELQRSMGVTTNLYFGHTKEQLDALKADHWNPMDFIGINGQGRYYRDDRLREALMFIQKHTSCPEFPNGLGHLTENVWKPAENLHHDWMTAADFVGNPKAGVVGYWDSQEGWRNLFLDRDKWLDREIITLRALSHFSSNDTLGVYAKDLWDIKPEEPALRNGNGRNHSLIL